MYCTRRANGTHTSWRTAAAGPSTTLLRGPICHQRSACQPPPSFSARTLCAGQVSNPVRNHVEILEFVLLTRSRHVAALQFYLWQLNMYGLAILSRPRLLLLRLLDVCRLLVAAPLFVRRLASLSLAPWPWPHCRRSSHCMSISPALCARRLRATYSVLVLLA